MFILGHIVRFCTFKYLHTGVRERNGRVLDARQKGRGFEPHRRHCVVSLSKNINPSLVLVQPRKTRPFITERLLMGCKESNQTNKKKHTDVKLSADFLKTSLWNTTRVSRLDPGFCRV